MSDKVTVELEINSELMRWFEEYCKDGLLDLDEELVAVITQHISEQMEEVGDISEVVNYDDEDELEEYSDFDDEEKDE